MKLIIYIAILTALSCKVQNPIVSLDAPYNTPEGAYYKDLNNELNKFVGTWKFQNNNSVFILTLQKLQQLQIGNDYRDYLVGEYSYTENGILIVNTLPINLSQDSNVGGSYIIDNNNYLSCDDCTVNERRISLYFNDPERSYLSTSIILRYLVGQTNPEKMIATIVSDHGGILPSADSPATMRIPLGEYLMVKQ